MTIFYTSRELSGRVEKDAQKHANRFRRRTYWATLWLCLGCLGWLTYEAALGEYRIFEGGDLAAAIFQQFYTGVTVPLPDFKAQLPQPAPLAQESAAWGLAQWLEFEKRGENDDRTVAVLQRLPQMISY